MLEGKKSRFNSLIRNDRFMSDANKFSSNMGQVVMRVKEKDKDDEKAHALATRVPFYSFSYPFTYWDKCKHSKQRSTNGYLKDFYVPSKHNSLKDELLHNSISQIGLHTWNAAYEQAENQKKTSRYKAKTATFESEAEEPNQLRDDHAMHYGYKEGDPLELKHLICLILYCSEGVFQARYSATYRKLCDTDTFEIIRERHSTFHHFAKALKEAVEVFGTFYFQSCNGVKAFYHGINTDMMFYSTTAQIHTVLSTTISYSVARDFAADNGLIVT
eukprot:919251_1